MRRPRLLSLMIIAAVSPTFLGGCAQLMGGLRQDLDDSEPYAQPTVGGNWPEGGFLSEDVPEGGPYSGRYSSVGHHERDLSSVSQRSDGALNDRATFPQDELSSANTPVVEPTVRRLYKNGSRATRKDFIDDSQNEGSLWASSGQTNYYFTQNKVHGAGDILTIKIGPDLVRDIGFEVKRSLTPAEMDTELSLAETKLQGRAPASATPGSGAATPQNRRKSIRGPQATIADVDVGSSLSLKAGDPMMAEVLQRYPNGNYRIRGVKRIPYKNGKPRLVTLVGIVRGSDISDDDTVSSGKLYEYQLRATR